jgi:hypothetical protein
MDLAGENMNMFTVDKFRKFTNTHPAMLFPAFRMQLILRTAILGTHFWDRCAAHRMRLTNGKYITVSSLAEVNVDEIMYNQVVEGKHGLMNPRNEMAMLLIESTGTYHYRRKRAQARAMELQQTKEQEEREALFKRKQEEQEEEKHRKQHQPPKNLTHNHRNHHPELYQNASPIPTAAFHLPPINSGKGAGAAPGGSPLLQQSHTNGQTADHNHNHNHHSQDIRRNSTKVPPHLDHDALLSSVQQQYSKKNTISTKATATTTTTTTSQHNHTDHTVQNQIHIHKHRPNDLSDDEHEFNNERMLQRTLDGIDKKSNFGGVKLLGIAAGLPDPTQQHHHYSQSDRHDNHNYTNSNHKLAAIHLTTSYDDEQKIELESHLHAKGNLK